MPSWIVAMLVALPLFLNACNDEDPVTAEAVVNTLTFEGRINLNPDFSSSILSSALEPGGFVNEANVFIKGVVSDSTLSDVDGYFSLQINLEDVLSLTGEEAEYTVVMWKTDGENKFGTNEKVSAQPSETPYDLGTVTLTYTNAIHFHIKDESTNEYVTSECSISVDGYGDKIPTTKIGNGLYDSSYMPPDSYQFIFSCEGYEDLAKTVEVVEATKIDDWMTENISVVKEE